MEEIKDNLIPEKWSNSLRVILIVIAGLIIIIGAFSLGVFVGYKKATFSYAWAENYNRNFGAPKRAGMPGFLNDNGFVNGYGIAGSILKIENSLLTLKSNNNIETPVLITDDTTVMKQRGTINPAGLNVDDDIVIIGSPNNSGQIEAKFIRVFPGQSPIPGRQLPAPMMRVEK